MYTFYTYFSNVFVNNNSGAVTVQAHQGRSVAGVTTRIRLLDGRDRLFLVTGARQDLYQQRLDFNFYSEIFGINRTQRAPVAQIIFYFGGSEVARTGFFDV